MESWIWGEVEDGGEVRGTRYGGIDHITSIVFGIRLGSEFWV
jgi:hypothetical protein